MMNVVVYTKPGCSECEQVIFELSLLQSQVPHRLVEIDINNDENLKKVYEAQVPIVQIGPFSLRGDITRERLLIALAAAQDRSNHLGRIHNSTKDDEPLARSLTTGERFSGWMARHYIRVINIVLAIFICGAFLPPLFMRAGNETAARIIYALYSPFCHQLPFRSWFLFGEQAYYPRELAQIPGILTYEQIVGSDDLDLLVARDYTGDETHGYKTALCQRDLAIFLSMLIFGFYFDLRGKRVRPIRWYILIILGLLPMLIDGASQLKGVLVSELPSWLPIRESTPLIRVVTGSLFGFLTAWFVFPYIEESAQLTQQMLARRKVLLAGMKGEGK